jgi:hypothetical protein
VIHGPKNAEPYNDFDEKQVVDTLEQTLREFARRHRIFQVYFINIAEKIRGIIEGMQINYDGLSNERKCSLAPTVLWNML